MDRHSSHYSHSHGQEIEFESRRGDDRPGGGISAAAVQGQEGEWGCGWSHQWPRRGWGEGGGGCAEDGKNGEEGR